MRRRGTFNWDSDDLTPWFKGDNDECSKCNRKLQSPFYRPPPTQAEVQMEFSTFTWTENGLKQYHIAYRKWRKHET